MPEYAWEMLREVGLTYHAMHRIFRRLYKWTIADVDESYVRRIVHIYKECVEDIENRNTSLEEDDLIEDL